jgi:hypothetical protein
VVGNSRYCSTEAGVGTLEDRRVIAVKVAGVVSRAVTLGFLSMKFEELCRSRRDDRT